MTAKGEDGIVDIGADIFADPAYVRNDLPPRPFRPWHRPRKHFVRRNQWRSQTLRILDGRNDSSALSYLGLPGSDLLDLRYLYQEVCVPQGRPLRFLGFNNEASPSNPNLVHLNTSLAELRGLENIDMQSEILPDDFRSLAHGNSIAWQRALHLGPFDVINLDLCDGLAAEAPGTPNSMYAALSRLMSLQVRSPHPWLLLITTRVDRQGFDTDALVALLDRLQGRFASCAEFSDECAKLLGVLEPATLDAASCEAPQFIRLITVAMSLWLVALGQVSSPNDVELGSLHAYRVNPKGECEDLVSFALRFSPVLGTPPDPLAPEATPPIDECATSAAIAQRAVVGWLDVDAILAADAPLTEDLTSEMAALLKLARYDGSDYREWLASQ